MYNVKAAAYKNGFQVQRSDVQHMQQLNHDLFRSENDSSTHQLTYSVLVSHE